MCVSPHQSVNVVFTCETEAKGKRPLVLGESVQVQVSFKFPQLGSEIPNNVLDILVKKKKL